VSDFDGCHAQREPVCDESHASRNQRTEGALSRERTIQLYHTAKPLPVDEIPLTTEVALAHA